MWCRKNNSTVAAACGDGYVRKQHELNTTRLQNSSFTSNQREVKLLYVTLVSPNWAPVTKTLISLLQRSPNYLNINTSHSQSLKLNRWQLRPRAFLLRLNHLGLNVSNELSESTSSTMCSASSSLSSFKGNRDSALVFPAAWRPLCFCLDVFFQRVTQSMIRWENNVWLFV